MAQDLRFNFQAFSQAAERSSSGLWGLEEATGWIQLAYQQVSEETEQVMSLLQRTSYGEESPQEIEEGLGGLRDYQQALESLWEYLEGGRPQDLERALQGAGRADRRLRSALDLNQSKSHDLSFETVG